MNPAAKEREQTPGVIDQIALKEVDSYIERIEKQVENQQSPLQPAPSQTPAPDPVVDDMGKTVMAQFAATSKPKIVLPITEDQLREGLHHKLIDALRWLAEMAIYLIKKYPGRVFYKPKQ